MLGRPGLARSWLRWLSVAQSPRQVTGHPPAPAHWPRHRQLLLEREWPPSSPHNRWFLSLIVTTHQGTLEGHRTQEGDWITSTLRLCSPPPLKGIILRIQRSGDPGKRKPLHCRAHWHRTGLQLRQRSSLKRRRQTNIAAIITQK